MLAGAPFKLSDNDYDWLGPGIYFWESNPQRGFDFAQEASRRHGSGIAKPFVIGAVIELGLCLDLTTSSGVDWVRIAYRSLVEVSRAADLDLPKTSSRKDCPSTRVPDSPRKRTSKWPLEIPGALRAFFVFP